jgi:hypothetical protein
VGKPSFPTPLFEAGDLSWLVEETKFPHAPV